MDQFVGIDFGSAKTTVARFSQDDHTRIRFTPDEFLARTLQIPSVLYIPSDENRSILVGQLASQMANSDPDGVLIDLKNEVAIRGSVILGGGRRTIDRVELVRLLFASIKTDLERTRVDIGSTQAVVGVPVSSPGNVRAILRDESQRLGFKSVTILEEPIAAANYWRYFSESDVINIKQLVVCDVGARSCRLSLVDCRSKTFRLMADPLPEEFEAGGSLIDQSLVECALLSAFPSEEMAEFPVLPMLFRMEIAKVQFCRSPEKILRLSLAGRECEITSESVNGAIAPFIRAIVDRTESFINRALRLLKCDCVNVLLVGRGSQIIGLKEQLNQLGQVRICRCDDPGSAIAFGCAVARLDPSTKNTVTIIDIEPVDGPSNNGQDPRPNQVEATAVHPPEEFTSYKSLRKAASAGNAEAQDQLGDVCASGAENGRRDLTEAFYWKSLAAHQGVLSAKLYLVTAYLNGVGIQKNTDLARRWSVSAAVQGDSESQYFVGEVLADAFDLEQIDLRKEHERIRKQHPWLPELPDASNPIFWLTNAAEQGHKKAQSKLGQILFKLKEDPANAAQAVKWLNAADDDKSQFLLAVCLRDGTGTKADPEVARQLFERLAKTGDPSAKLALAEMTLEDPDANADLKSHAVDWLRKSAKSGNIPAARRLALSLSQHEADLKLSQEAAQIWKIVAESGDPDAMVQFGLKFERGIGVPQSFEDAFNWYTKAARENFPAGKRHLGMLLLNPRFSRCSASAGMKSLEAAGNQGDGHACYLIGCRIENMARTSVVRNVLVDFCLVGHEESEAFRWFEKSAKADFPAGWAALAWCNSLGVGCEKKDDQASNDCMKNALRHMSRGALYVLLADRYLNVQTLPEEIDGESVAAEFYQTAHANDHMDGTYHLALCLLAGKGIEQSSVEGVNLLHRAATANHAEAQYRLAKILAKGGLVEPDPKKAFALMKTAASSGHSGAQFLFYRHLIRSYDTKPNDAILWLERAANQQHAQAEMEFARRLWNGDKCVKNRQRAQVILEGCARAGVEKAVSTLAELKQQA